MTLVTISKFYIGYYMYTNSPTTPLKTVFSFPCTGSQIFDKIKNLMLNKKCARLFCQQMPDRLEGEDEDNDSARKAFSLSNFNLLTVVR